VQHNLEEIQRTRKEIAQPQS